MFFVYLLQNTESKDLYIGYTNNIKRRLKEHNNKENFHTGKYKGYWKIIYCEIYRSQEDAVTREQKLKSHGSGKHELYKRLSKSFLS
jgi:putative endonuclease